MHAPCAIAPFYGRLLWLNRDGRLSQVRRARAVFMVGAGGHNVWIDPGSTRWSLLRWLDEAHSASFVRRVAQALRKVQEPKTAKHSSHSSIVSLKPPKRMRRHARAPIRGAKARPPVSALPPDRHVCSCRYPRQVLAHLALDPIDRLDKLLSPAI